jgi:hypothetical protein
MLAAPLAVRAHRDGANNSAFRAGSNRPRSRKERAAGCRFPPGSFVVHEKRLIESVDAALPEPDTVNRHAPGTLCPPFFFL